MSVLSSTAARTIAESCSRAGQSREMLGDWELMDGSPPGHTFGPFSPPHLLHCEVEAGAHILPVYPFQEGAVLIQGR